jgi:hypothetical protein
LKDDALALTTIGGERFAEARRPPISRFAAAVGDALGRRRGVSMIDAVHTRRPPKSIALDTDTSESPRRPEGQRPLFRV